MTKPQIHSVLESILHAVAKDGEARQARITIPYYELARELGFGEPSPGSDILITITAELSDESGADA